MVKPRSIFSRLVNNVTLGTTNLALLTFLVLFIVYTLFWPITPATYSNLVLQNPNNIVAGQTLNYSIDGCRKVGDSVVTTITRSLVSTTDKKLLPISLSTDTVANPARCTHSNRSVLLPYSIPAGKYELVIRGVYQIIPLRRPIAVQIESKEFTVKTVPISDQIQSLINANNLLQSQLQAQQSSKATTPTVATTPKITPTQTTVNNTTVNNPAPTPPASTTPTGGSTGSTGGTGGGSSGGSGGSQNESLIDGLINAIGGGIKWVL